MVRRARFVGLRQWLFIGIAAIALCVASIARAEPGLWVVKGARSTIYLFGTVHTLRKDQPWASPQVAKALAESDELWLEIPDPEDTRAAQALIAQFGFDRQHPLSTKLPASDIAHLDAAAKSVGLRDGEKTFEPTRPWLASVMLEDAMLVHAGYDSAGGVERQLLREANRTGKPVRGFETLDQQIRIFADMPPATEVQLLQNTLQDFDQGAAKLDALVAAWLEGDDVALARIMVDEIRQPFPALYRTILVDRNEAFAAALTRLVAGSGVKFVAVGAAHLAGTDSVQVALKRHGIAVQRITRPN